MALSQEQLRINLESVIQRMRDAELRAGRAHGSCRLVAVTKTHPASLLPRIAELGVKLVGENKVQEAAGKIEELESAAALPPGLEWHLIGHLQTNKARQAVRYFSLIHSVDSIRLATELDKAAEKIGKQQHILLQVNVSGEDSKSGCQPGELPALLQHVLDTCNHLVVRGFMTMAPLEADPASTRPVFRGLRELADQIRERFPVTDRFPATVELSMGMTNDFEIAVEEGATLVRVGSALFGSR